ncbi:FIST N-terminal domain-containing protein [Marinospirillum sp.]|uniref:FIST N-terminal domain-containing protein n=1 Tax=Marinospirillum sp. TaxID=2183934 RepID=UPI003A8A808C
MLDPYVIATSQHTDPQQAVADIAAQIDQTRLGGLIFFCSAHYPLEALATALNQQFAGCEMAGCTSAGELTHHGYATDSLVVLGLHHDAFIMRSALIQPLSSFDRQQAALLCDQLFPAAGAGFQPLVLSLFDGLSSQEEWVLAALEAELGGIAHCGGSAADDIHLRRTHVFYRGAFHTHAGVVIGLQTCLPFAVFSHHHLRPLHTKLVVTEADPHQRRVYELNGMPAAQAYAELIGQPLEQLNPVDFALHPLAVKRGETYYVRAIQQVNRDASLDFYCAMGKGSVLTQMYAEDLTSGLDEQWRQLEANLGPAAFILACDCVLRRLESEERQQQPQLAAFLRQRPLIGFNTYGEQATGVHLNHTITGFFFGYPRGQHA